MTDSYNQPLEKGVFKTPFFLAGPVWVMAVPISLILVATLFAGASCAADVPVYRAELMQVFDAPIARQGVAVDGQFFYVVTNNAINKRAKVSGDLVSEWPGEQSEGENNPLIHMDSLVVHEGRLYASHSNYPKSPMTSSIEIWDAETMRHVASHSLGVNRGSLTWLDRYDGSWWGAFANYDKVQTGQTNAYGLTDNTQVVRFDEDFVVVESWVLPQNILDRIRPMSNSGGSWGPDGYLYLTGHDHGEIYIMQLPRAGSVLNQVATVEVPVMEGQGIAWDRSGSGRYLWGINKQKRKVAHLKMPEITGAGVPQLPQSVQ